MVKRAIDYLKVHGVRRTAGRAFRLLVPKRSAAWPRVREALRGRRGLEVGGPTLIFTSRQLLPVYDVVGSLDNVNYADRTVWTDPGTAGGGEPGGAFAFGGRSGRQFVSEATDLSALPDASYEMVAASHVIEHLANPLKGVGEWLRVLSPGGHLLLIVPHRDGTFDHRRPVTPISHLQSDLAAGTDESDLTHLDEILSLHDLSRDPGAGALDAFRQRSLRNRENRCLHHHVFTTASVVELLDHLGLDVVAVDAQPPYHIVALARKPLPGDRVDNARWLGADAAFRRNSPFPSDRGRPEGAATA